MNSWGRREERENVSEKEVEERTMGSTSFSSSSIFPLGMWIALFFFFLRPEITLLLTASSIGSSQIMRTQHEQSQSASQSTRSPLHFTASRQVIWTIHL